MAMMPWYACERPGWADEVEAAYWAGRGFPCATMAERKRQWTDAAHAVQFSLEEDNAAEARGEAAGCAGACGGGCGAGAFAGGPRGSDFNPGQPFEDAAKEIEGVGALVSRLA